MDHALRLEGLVRHASTHAAGVVLSNLPLVDHCPLFVDKEGGIVTQYEMSWVEKIGLVKFDFLGLKTLTLLHDCLKLIEITRGDKIDIDICCSTTRRLTARSVTATPRACSNWKAPVSAK